MPSFVWHQIRVPALPEATVERLRGLRREDLDPLAVILQLDPDDEGLLRIVEPEPPFDPTVGARLRGQSVQFGLTRAEIDDVWDRIQALLARVDEGELTLF